MDLAVISLVENEMMDKKDFIVTENYNLRLRGSGAKKVANEFSSMMSQAVSYGDKQTTWGSILLFKTKELAHYLVGKTKNLDFFSPGYGVQRVDSLEIRQKILKISYSDWKRLGFSKGTLNYLKQNANSGKPFSLNSHVLKRLKAWEI